MRCNNCGIDFDGKDLDHYLCSSCEKEYSFAMSVDEDLPKLSPENQASRAVRGVVKWFSKEKGYGFIVGNDKVERYFHVKDIVGAKLPDNGDTVTFIAITADKGPKATEINIVTVNSNGGKVKCNHCGKEMIPRIITGPPIITTKGGWTPVPVKSICPFCASDYKHFSRQWFGSPLEMVGSIIAFIIIAFVAIAFLK